jgi:hypothetical protein
VLAETLAGRNRATASRFDLVYPARG